MLAKASISNVRTLHGIDTVGRNRCGSTAVRNRYGCTESLRLHGERNHNH